MELYAKHGQIVDQKTGKTVGLIPYFDADNQNHVQLQNVLAAAPKMLEALQTLSSILTSWNKDGKYINEIEHANQAIQKALNP